MRVCLGQGDWEQVWPAGEKLCPAAPLQAGLLSAAAFWQDIDPRGAGP